MVLHEFGLQLCLKAHSRDIKTTADVLCCFMHWRLLRYGFICLGEGLSESRTPSEVLPLNLGWDGDLKGYFLKYENRRKQFLLSIYVRSNFAEVSLLSDAKVAKIDVDLLDVVTNDKHMDLTTSENLAFSIDMDIIHPLGFKKVDERWLQNWEDRRALMYQEGDDE